MSRLTGPSDSLQHTKTRTVLDFGPFTTCGSMPWLFLCFDLNRVEEGKSTLVMIKKMKKIGDRSNAAGERRVLRGLGSSPPRCLSKCGRCTPCKPVHVPVPPGTPVTAEYYPEAWRCKCGNKLYMP
uniref:Epidermal patterning factor-like protein n=1 Tax=Brassica campestris TaxID=3711 RepID=M4DYN4_BRACM